MKSNVVFRPTVIIGLGGTGSGAVLKLKKRFMDTYAGSVPPIVRFLAFDTTETSEPGELARDGSLITLEPNIEHFVISVTNPAGLVNGTNEHIDAWWPKNIPVAAITAGAGQVRARGRLALFARSNEIFSRIRNAVDQVNAIKNTKLAYQEAFNVSERGGVEIYIVGSLAGGTGSGMILDVAFIARSFVSDDSNLTGVLVLPRVFSSLPGTALVRPNAYGALKEIEHFSTLGPQNRMTIDYGHPNQVDVGRPPFDLLYLVDSTNESGRIISDTSDLLSIVADGLYVQIGSQIGTDSANAVDNIKTQLAVAGRVRGRSASYCSFGVASMMLPTRQYEIMKIDAARKLLCDGLINGVFPDADLEAEVARFVQDNKLKEDEADDVIDALSQRDGGGIMRFPMPLGGIKFNGEAPRAIKDLHIAHRSKIDRSITQGIESNYKQILSTTTQAIEDWWHSAINRPNGLTYANRFSEKLLTKLEWYQHMMESESREEQERLKAVNFKLVEEQVREAAGAWINRESRVRTAAENYKGLVDRESDLALQVARRNKAAELFGALRTRVEELILHCASIRNALDTTLKMLERQFLEASNKRGGESPFEHIVAFDIQSNVPTVKTEDFIKSYCAEHKTLSTWSGMQAEDIHRDIVAYVSKQFESLTDLSIDDVLRRSALESQGRDLNQLQQLAVPLWRYDDGKIPVVNRGQINELFHYGVENSETTVLKDPKTSRRVPRGATDPSIVSTLDQKKITLFKVKIGIPLFALNGIEEMERAYNDPDKVVSNHLHRDWESFPNIIPRAGGGAALGWFAIAQAPAPFGLINRRGEWYYARSKKGKRTEDGEVRLGQGRVNAYAAFEKDADLVKEIEEKIDAIMRTEGEAKTYSLLRDYTDQLAKQVSGGKVDAAVKEQVEGEIQAIEDYLKRRDTIR